MFRWLVVAAALAALSCGPNRNLGRAEGTWPELDMKGEDPLGLLAQMPEAGQRGFSLLVANVGNSDLFHCAGDARYKLCMSGAERAVAERIAELLPDVVMLSELLPPQFCDGLGTVPHRHVCHPDHTRREKEQVRRLLGPGYTIACEPRNRNECVAVRRGFGRIPGCADGQLCDGVTRSPPLPEPCELGLDINPTGIHAGWFSMAITTVELDGRKVDLINGHPPAVMNATAAQCREKFFRPVLEPAGAAGSVREQPLAILGGDLNFDPFRNAATDADVVYWKTRVRLSLDGTGGPFVLHSGPIERDAPYWTTPLARRTLDHVASEGFVGRCRTLGGAAGFPPLDDNYGEPLERLDHLAQFCVLEVR